MFCVGLLVHAQRVLAFKILLCRQVLRRVVAFCSCCRVDCSGGCCAIVICDDPVFFHWHFSAICLLDRVLCPFSFPIGHCFRHAGPHLWRRGSCCSAKAEGSKTSAKESLATSFDNRAVRLLRLVALYLPAICPLLCRSGGGMVYPSRWATEMLALCRKTRW